eukprot:comp22370_c0_seq1/m.54167 comp22370_c0_seq1/g.54167  ORF comp22370_c0_seq1/g.54167 comp22370_c0_seq1/m.54167 type:complete len:302 (-) comp22370_c0_seq1:4-909(-)
MFFCCRNTLSTASRSPCRAARCSGSSVISRRACFSLTCSSIASRYCGYAISTSSKSTLSSLNSSQSVFARIVALRRVFFSSAISPKNDPSCRFARNFISLPETTSSSPLRMMYISTPTSPSLITVVVALMSTWRSRRTSCSRNERWQSLNMGTLATTSVARSRPNATLIIFSRASGNSLITSSNCALSIDSTLQSLAVRTVAFLVWSLSSASSPKNAPGPSCATTFSSTTTSTVPRAIRYIAVPTSPCLNTIAPEAICLEMSECTSRVRNSSERSAKMGTFFTYERSTRSSAALAVDMVCC